KTETSSEFPKSSFHRTNQETAPPSNPPSPAMAGSLDEPAGSEWTRSTLAPFQRRLAGLVGLALGDVGNLGSDFKYDLLDAGGCYDQTANRLRYIKHLRVAPALTAHGGRCRLHRSQDRNAATQVNGETRPTLPSIASRCPDR